MDTQQVSKLKKVGLACLLACVATAASANDRDKAKRPVMGQIAKLSEVPETVISSGRWQPLNERLGISNFGIDMASSVTEALRRDRFDRGERDFDEPRKPFKKPFAKKPAFDKAKAPRKPFKK